MRRFIKLSIVGFWLVMVGVLVQRNLPNQHSHPSPSPPLAPTSTEVQSQEEWMGIYHQDQKVGYLQRRLSPIATGYQWEETWRMRMRFLDTPQTIHTEIRAETDPAFALTRFEFRLLSSGLTFRASGEVKGHTLQGQMVTGNTPSPFSLPLQTPLYLPSATQMTFRHTLLQSGEERSFTIFNPLTMRTEAITVSVLGTEMLTIKGQEIRATKVAERLGETTAHAWLDPTGKVLKEEASLGMVLLRESEEDALGGGWQDSTPFDLVASSAIPVRQALSHPRAITALRLQVESTGDSLQFSFPPRQHQDGNTLTVSQEALTALTTYRLPQSAPQFAPDLAATPFLQSAHPRVLAQVQQVLGDEHDALRATQRLLDWTYNTVEKAPTVSLPTALEVLDSRKGDCNEHAVLFTALARAAGIPARVAAGVVYLDGAFYYHAWSEVWLGQWVAADPTFHQLPADATHIKFIEGGPEQHMALLKVIGQIKMEVVEYK